MASKTGMNKSFSGILDLPPELVTHIIDYTHHSEHFNFASTCRFLHNCSKDILEAHRKAYEEYHTCSDVLPNTVPNLLRKILDDPMVAWHVRCLEFYEMRDCWAWWRPCQFVSEKSSSVRGRGKPLPYALDQDERARCLELLGEQLFFAESDLEKARADFEAGNDAPIKALIVALCPRLESLKFSRDLIVSGRAAFDPLESFPPRPPARDCRMGYRPLPPPRSCLEYIQRTVLHYFSNTAGQLKWPVGFLSLSNLAVGMQTDTELDELSTESPPCVLFDLMRLPNLTSVYWDWVDLGTNSENERDTCDLGIPSRSSSVQHIFIDIGFWLRIGELLSASRCLKSLAFADANMHLHHLPKLALALQHDSLESLVFYKSKLNPDLLWWEHVQDPSFLFARLKAMTIDYDDFFRRLVEESSDAEATEQSPARLDFCDWTKRRRLPRNLEVIVLAKSLWTNPLSETEADDVDDAMLSLIACKATFLPNLKSVFLGALEDESRSRWTTREHVNRTRRWFTKSIRAGREAGVDVHTRTTRGPYLHHVELPKPPCSADLKFVQRRDEEPPEFDVYSGEWTIPGCGNCGRCQGCLRLYEAPVWKKIERE